MLSTIFIASTVVFTKTPSVHQQWVALQSARKCMEWFVGYHRSQSFSALTCPSTPSANVCAPPSGYSATINVECTNWNGDSNYKTITVTISGLANANLSVMLGKYR